MNAAELRAAALELVNRPRQNAIDLQHALIYATLAVAAELEQLRTDNLELAAGGITRGLQGLDDEQPVPYRPVPETPGGGALLEAMHAAGFDPAPDDELAIDLRSTGVSVDVFARRETPEGGAP